MLNKLPH